MNSMMKILYRVRISQDQLFLNGSTLRQNRSIAKEVRRLLLLLFDIVRAHIHLFSCPVLSMLSQITLIYVFSPDLAAFLELSLLAIDSYEGINALAIDICVRVPDAIRCIVFPSLRACAGFSFISLAKKSIAGSLFSYTQRIAKTMPFTKRISRGRFASAQERFTVSAVSW